MNNTDHSGYQAGKRNIKNAEANSQQETNGKKNDDRYLCKPLLLRCHQRSRKEVKVVTSQ
jgi:hypothetical protein